MPTKEVENALDAVAGVDPVYQQIMQECVRAAEEYIRILGGLSEEDRSCLEYYVSRCRELEYRRTCLAYGLGRLAGIS